MKYREVNVRFHRIMCEDEINTGITYSFDKVNS